MDGGLLGHCPGKVGKGVVLAVQRDIPQVWQAPMVVCLTHKSRRRRISQQVGVRSCGFLLHCVYPIVSPAIIISCPSPQAIIISPSLSLPYLAHLPPPPFPSPPLPARWLASTARRGTQPSLSWPTREACATRSSLRLPTRIPSSSCRPGRVVGGCDWVSGSIE